MLQGIRQIGTLRLRLRRFFADEPDVEPSEILVANPLLATVVPLDEGGRRRVVGADAQYLPVTHRPLERDLDDAACRGEVHAALVECSGFDCHTARD